MIGLRCQQRVHHRRRARDAAAAFWHRCCRRRSPGGIFGGIVPVLSPAGKGLQGMALRPPPGGRAEKPSEVHAMASLEVFLRRAGRRQLRVFFQACGTVLFMAVLKPSLQIGLGVSVARRTPGHTGALGHWGLVAVFRFPQEVALLQLSALCLRKRSLEPGLRRVPRIQSSRCDH